MYQEIEFIAPYNPGDYRIFIYVRDEEGKIALGNIPFHIENLLKN